MSNETSQKILKLVANEIICGLLLENIPGGGLCGKEIGSNFRAKIGPECFKEFKEILTSEFPKSEAWKTIVESLPDVKYKKGKLNLKTHRRGTSSGDTMAIRKYTLEILYQMVIVLLKGHLEDVNQKGMNGNTLLHLVASLPTENINAMSFQFNVLKLLIDASADCSLKNDQGMTPLHIIAGDYLLDPNKDFALSHKRGLANECNTNGRLQKLCILEPMIQKPFMERGRYGNSILHEWVINCSGHNKMSPIEEQIGDWIIESANVPTYLANDYNCNALHYAFTDDLVKILCQHKSHHDTDRFNADGDTPFLHIIKNGLLRRLANIAHETDFEGILAAEMNINFNSDPNNVKHISINGNKVDDLNLKTFEKNGFDIAACDSTKRNCLDYLLAFVNALLSFNKESPHFQEVLKYIVESWIQSVLRSGGAFDNQAERESTLSKLIKVFFEAGSTDQLTSEMIFNCIKKLFVQGADPNMITCPDSIHVLLYCCTKAIRGNDLHLRLVEILCENGASKNTKNLKDQTWAKMLSDSGGHDILQIIKDTKPKRRVTLDIQSVRYKDQLDSLSREVQPQRIDDRLAYRYDPNLIGEGAISFVFLAIDDKAKRELALKRIDRYSYKKQMTAEIKALKDLEQNQNVINFYNLEETKDFYYLAIELMDGDLTALVKNKQLHHHLSDNAAYHAMQKLAADIVRGMEFLHRKGMIHRDIKPGNILYREEPELTLKLADFGLAKKLNSCDQSTVLSANSTSLCGTRGWMAPELIRRAQPSPTKETDMFALGLVLHFLFSKGYHPFHSVAVSLVQDLSTGKLRPHEIESNISEKKMKIYRSLKKEQSHLVMSLLNDNPTKRPGSNDLLKEHCYFWSCIKKVYFMWKVGDQPEVAKPTSPPTTTFGSSLRNSKLGTNISQNAWNTMISQDLFQEVSKRKNYDTSSLLGLIRFFRNAYAHYEERSSNCNAEILNDEIFKKIPDFFVTVWKEVLSQGWVEQGSGKDMLLNVINKMD